MPVRRPRQSPFVAVDRDLILDGCLSPISKLLHIVLLALPEDADIDFAATAALVGVHTAGELEKHLEELTDAGLLEKGTQDGEPVLTVHEAAS
ncbi:hypothetical protein ACFC08_29780 [Streptomyces sp. NPDC056112]|uniref:hypothetical protein n=1 Tax=Streptomyces sp. NPDC056112 TaxID=3345715 RepID=UPI0035DF1A7B